MAETLLSFGVEKLWDLLVRESDRFQGVEEQFNELKSDLDMLRCFLEDADAKKHTSAVVRNTVKEIKEIVYDAEDIIETFLLKEELGKTSGIWHTVRRFSKRRELAFDMKSISKRISKVSRYMQSLGVQQDSAYRDTQSLLERQREMRQTFSSDNEDHLVGLEKNVEQLVGYLVEQDSNQVVSITGMGGIGKTTLARQVFNHEMVKNHFDGVAWVCISQQFTRTYVWQTILQQLSSKHDEHRESNMTEDDLQKKLFLLLETSNYLIILDDMWKEEDWDRIKPVFPSKKGWKVLFTSRNERVALRADPTCVTFKPECLTIEESWTLFRRIAFPRKDTSEYNVDEDMEEMGKKMIKHCGGLPLAVKVLGGLLASQHTLSEWNRVCENIGSHIVGGTSFNERNISSVYHLLSLSFEELPVYLKQCFLYFAHFPEDYPIRVWDLAYYWAAEGIPRPRYYDGATIREVANRYIEELVKRNMVISKRDVATSRFETCHLHDMMREVCLRKAEEENFVHIVDIANSQSSCTSRRIAVHQFDETYYLKWEMEESLSGLLQNPKLRSIWFINFTWKKVWMESRLCFTRLKLMRVLDLSYTIFEGGKLLSDIGKLIHLRYLSLYRAKVSHLPSSMRNLKLLLYLNLDVVARSLLYMAPNFLKEMRELTYLSLPLNMHEKTKLELGNLVNLETLLHFSTKNSSVRDLHRMTKLRTLKFWNCPKLKELPNGFPQLHTLDLGGLDEWEEWIVKEGSMPLLHFLSIRLCPKLKKLPDGQHFPSHLTTINLIGCRLVEDPMPTLEKLLHLKKVTLPKSFSGRRMVCSGGGFPQLHTLELSGLEELEEWIVEEGSMPLLHSLNVRYCLKLKKLPAGGFPQLQKLFLHGLKEWEEWIVEEGSMPLLHTLEICDCEKLKKLPDGLRFIYSLKDLSLDKEWKERTSDGGEDYYKVQHIPFVEFY